MYCDTETAPLSKEHIVPFALNGVHTLQNASCRKCAELTSKIEASVLKTTFIAGRRFFRMRSRRIKNWDKFEETFLALLFPSTPMPGYLLEIPNTSKGINIVDLKFIPLAVSSPAKFSTNFNGLDFFRMLSKIALGFSIAEFGYTNFESFYVRDIILGMKDDIGHWVGTADDCIFGIDDAVYKIKVVRHANVIICRIKLFALLQVPEYLVVVGKLKSNLS